MPGGITARGVHHKAKYNFTTTGCAPDGGSLIECGSVEKEINCLYQSYRCGAEKPTDTTGGSPGWSIF